MKKIITLALSLVLTSSLLLLTPLAHSEGVFSNSKFSFLKDEPKLMPVDEAFVFDFKQEGEQLKISWVIADGYYMYRDKLKFEAEGALLGEIALPKGKEHNDEYFGEQEVYYSFVEFPIAIKEASDQSNVTITFMGCAEGKLCFPPTKKQALLSAVPLNDGLLKDKAQELSTPEASSKTVTEPITQQDSLSQMLSGDSLLWTLVIFLD